MRSRVRQRSWQTVAFVLAGLMAFAVPVSAKPGSSQKLWSSKANTSRHNSGKQQRFEKLDKEMKSRSSRLLGTSKVILEVKPGQEANAEKEIKKLGGRLGRRLKLFDGVAVELPNRVIKQISERSEVLSVHHDRPIAGHLNRTAVSIGARAAQQQWGYTGAGIGVAVIDSGITSWHDDLGYKGTSTGFAGQGQRVAAFVDFVNGRSARLRRQRPRHARAGHHRRQWLRLARRARRHRARGAPRQPEGARRAGQRRHQRRHRRASSGPSPTARRTTSASSTCRWAPRVTESYRDRSAHARRQARRRRRHRGRHRRPATSAEARRAEDDAVRRHHGARQCAMGADGRRVEHRGNRRRERTT